MLSMSVTAGSCPAIAASRRQSACLVAHRFAACRAKVVRWTLKAGEQVAEVAPEVGVQAPVGVEAEELADDLDRQHLAVGEDRRRAALTEPTFAAQVADEVVHEAEHGDDEGLQVHDHPPLRLNPRKERPGATMAPSATRSLGNLHIGFARAF